MGPAAALSQTSQVHMSSSTWGLCAALRSGPHANRYHEELRLVNCCR